MKITHKGAMLAGALAIASAHAQLAQPDGGGVRPGTLPERWETGGPLAGSLATTETASRSWWSTRIRMAITWRAMRSCER